MIATLLIILGVLTRLIIHVPNFTPVIAIALFGGVYLNKKWAMVIPLLAMAISDIFLGFHDTMFFTLGSMVLISGLGLWLRNMKSTRMVILFSFISAVLFFIVTNFGVWLVSGMYAKTFTGLAECFILALPFFKATLLSTLIYTAVLFGSYEILVNRVKKLRLA